MRTISAEKHFESLDEGVLRRRKRLIWVGILAVGVLLFFFAKSTLPSPRSEYYGRWKAGGRSKAFLEIRSNGTYTSRFQLEPEFGMNSWFTSDGTWRATHSTLYLTATEMKPDGILPNMSMFKTVKDRTLNREQRLRINWNTPDSINLNEVESETFTRGTSAP